MGPGDEHRYFRKHAAECERLAEISKNPRDRETLLYVASRWRAMADEDERRQRPGEPEMQSAYDLSGSFTQA
jgi:hypothetical protein